MITINIKGERYALAVEKIIGVQKVVVKNVEGLIGGDNIFDGTAMMGDGGVAMILGTTGLNKLIN